MPNNRITQKQFLEKAFNKHGNKYNYNKTIYIKNSENLIITCKIHGDFIQRAGKHLEGHGCVKCRGDLSKKLYTKTTDQFINESKNIHGNKFDYSLVEYKANNQNVKIICPDHGIIEMTPWDHKRAKYGCYYCGKAECSEYGKIYKTDLNLELYLYYIQLQNEEGIFYKIGLTKNLNERMNRFKSQLNNEIKILELEFGKLKDLFPKEKEFHKLFKEFGIQYLPKELKGNGMYECFKW